MVIIKTPVQIEGIRKSCKIVAFVLKELKGLIRPGVTTAGLNTIAEKLTRERGALPGFRGYRGFPFSICASLNEQIVHGFPNDIPLKDGDILSIDFGILYKGWYGDSAFTVGVGNIADEARHLIDVTRNSFLNGLRYARKGQRLGDISWAIQNTIEAGGLSVVRNFVGHGIGRELHEDPQIPNFGKKEDGLLLKAGMVLAIEPMAAIGSADNKTLSDGWTVITKDRSMTAHYEHTIVITDNGPEILTFRN